MSRMKNPKNSLNKTDVIHVARLAKLPLSPEEISKFQKQLSDVIEYVNQLNKVDTKGINPTNHVTDLENVLRNDEQQPSLTQKEALSNVKNSYNGFYKVGAIFDEE